MSSLVVVDNTELNASDQKKICVSDKKNTKDDFLLNTGQLNINGRNTNIDALPKYEQEIEQVMNVTCCSDRNMVYQVVVANKGDVNKSILTILDPPKSLPKPKKRSQVLAEVVNRWVDDNEPKKSSSSNLVEDLQHDLNLALMERENFLQRLKRIDQEVQKMALPNAFDVNSMEDFVFQFEAFKSWVAVAADPTQQLMTVEGNKKKSSIEVVD